MQNNRKLPIKIIIPEDNDFLLPPIGGSNKIFGEDIDEMRNTFIKSINTLRDYFQQDLSTPLSPPAVARVTLKSEAIAKSHRPNDLFSEKTCPIIGGERFGDILISLTNSGLAELESKAASGTSQKIVSNISTIQNIAPYTASDALGHSEIDYLWETMSKDGTTDLKLRLFNHKTQDSNKLVHNGLIELIKKLSLPTPEKIQCLSELIIYRIHDIHKDAIDLISRFVGTQSLGLFPQFGISAQFIPQGTATEKSFPKPDPNKEYPVVGIIDSGTDPANNLLKPWIVDRDEEDIPSEDQNNDHGSFVAALIAQGQTLNHGNSCFPSSQAKIIDVVGIPNDDTPIFEDELLYTIKRAVKKYPDIKIWNLSISRTDKTCQDDTFSTFAMELDAIQQRFGVTFVTCTGNYNEEPLRRWPPEDLGENDRIFPPADSVMSISVGAYAHLERHDSLVKTNEPSPFSRRGPGAAFLQKPEVCHYGGNCNVDMDCRQTGILSIDGSGNISEAIGTSFSTPLITSILGNLRHSVNRPISQNLAKALLIQSAALQSGPISATESRYRGFGIPGEIDQILTCSPWQATLIFEPKIQTTKRIFAREEFPIPDCFRLDDGRICGEFLMTLVYDPPLDPSAGAEYCQSNVEVSIGTYDKNSEGKAKHQKAVNAEPKGLQSLYETCLIENGHKWSPVKVFRQNFKNKSGDNWRIHIRLFLRGDQAIPKPQNIALVVTLFDPKKEKNVYNDVIAAMNRSGWVHQDLQVSDRIRLQA